MSGKAGGTGDGWAVHVKLGARPPMRWMTPNGDGTAEYMVWSR